ncbi:hypothetical protein [Poriferisphaera sp. WC338]|uniref:hypothetical protein n=1 Tax=Poriferisphaera sp. WC338 TaxID=3425129 RepID=UPI003D81B083
MKKKRSQNQQGGIKRKKIVFWTAFVMVFLCVDVMLYFWVFGGVLPVSKPAIPKNAQDAVVVIGSDAFKGLDHESKQTYLRIASEMTKKLSLTEQKSLVKKHGLAVVVQIDAWEEVQTARAFVFAKSSAEKKRIVEAYVAETMAEMKAWEDVGDEAAWMEAMSAAEANLSTQENAYIASLWEAAETMPGMKWE